MKYKPRSRLYKIEPSTVQAKRVIIMSALRYCDQCKETFCESGYPCRLLLRRTAKGVY